MSDDTTKAEPAMEQSTNTEGDSSGDGYEAIKAETDARTKRIQHLNDRLRTTGAGGKVMITTGIIDLDPETAARVLEAVRTYDDFGPGNDPWDEHDCASLTVDEAKVMWKIDYYERSGRVRSPDPADPKLTLRILTIMLADEY